MKLIREHIISRIICLLLALHLFNVCVDSPDAQPAYLPEDLSINEMESVVEIVLEKGFEIENAISEHDEPIESDTQNIEQSKELKLFTNHYVIKLINSILEKVKYYSFYATPSYSAGVQEINPPPPKA